MKTAELESADAVDGFSAAMKAQGHDDVDIRATEFPAPSTPGYADTPGEATGVVPIGAATLPQVKTGNGGTTGVIGGTGPSTSAPPDDSPANSSIADEPVSDEKQSVPQLDKQVLDSLLDELTGEFVALEDFPHEVDDRAFENEWLGRHTDLSLAVFQAELLKTREHTDDVDENGKLLSDPVKSRLARGNGARINLRVHRGLSEDKKIEFILRDQARERSRIEEEDRELKRRIILRWLALGLNYNSIAKIAGVHPNTVRNVETRAATDSNSKFGNTKKDRRFKPSTLKKIAEARKLRDEGLGDAEIAAIFNTDVETVGRWLKDPPAQGRKKHKEKHGKKPKTSRGNSAAQQTDATEAIMANEGIPKFLWPALKSLNQDARAYSTWLEAASAKARAAVKAAAGNVGELLPLYLYGSQLAATANCELRQILNIPSEATDKEPRPGKLYPDQGGCKVGDVLRGTVMKTTSDGVSVALSDGSGVIGVIDKSFEWKWAPIQGQIVRVRVEGFDSDRDLANLTLLGRQSVSHAECASAFGPRLDILCSPDTELAGLKVGPQEQEGI